LRAALLYGPRDVRVEEVKDPKPGDGWVRIRVEEVGICGTDKAFYRGSYRPGKLPIIPGHEICGVVDEVGAGVPKDVTGRRVTTEINIPCGKCWFCTHGARTHCPYREVIGITIDGGMAEHVLTTYENVHVVEPLTPAEGAFVEPLAAVIEMVKMRPPEPGSNIAVLGIGAIGLLSIQVLRLTAPNMLVAVARAGSPKARLAKALGADAVLTADEALELARRETREGQGFDYVVEATGSLKGLEIALGLVRPRGVVAAKSTHGEPTTFNYTSLVVKEVSLVGSRCGPFPPAIKLLRTGLVRVKDLVTSTYPLLKAPEAFAKSFERGEVRVHVKP